MGHVLVYWFITSPTCMTPHGFCSDPLGFNDFSAQQRIFKKMSDFFSPFLPFILLYLWKCESLGGSLDKICVSYAIYAHSPSMVISTEMQWMIKEGEKSRIIWKDEKRECWKRTWDMKDKVKQKWLMKIYRNKYKQRETENRRKGWRGNSQLRINNSQALLLA